MLTIKRGYLGYRVKISEPGMGVRGYTLDANTIEEACQVAKHYYSTCDGPTGCPLCRHLAAQQSKR